MRRGGALKSIVDVFVQVERAERTARRRHRDLMAQQQAEARHDQFLEKQREQELARYEVEEFEIRIDELLSVHHECVTSLDWERIAATPEPQTPPPQLPAAPVLQLPSGSYAAAAEGRLATYAPSLMDRMFGRVQRVRQELEAGVLQAREMDRQAQEIAHQEHLRTYALWNEHASQLHAQWQHEQNMNRARWQQTVALARSVFAGDPRAYTMVLQQSQCLAELEEKNCAPEGNWLGRGAAEVLLTVDQSTDLVPTERKSLTATKKLSVKKMPARESVEIYQDFVCGVAIRAAREVMAVLPLRGVLAGVVSPVLDKRTGHLEPEFILSVYIPRDAVVGRDFTRIDASDFVSSLAHSMRLKKGVGMDAVSPLDAEGFLGRGERIVPW